MTNIAWNDETRAWYEKYKDEGLEFDNPDTLFGRTLTTGEPLLSNDPANDPAGARCPAGTRRWTATWACPCSTAAR